MRRKHKITIEVSCDDEDLIQALESEFRMAMVGPRMGLYSNGSGFGGDIERQISHAHSYEVDIPKLSESQQKINSGQFDEYEDDWDDDY